MIAHAAYATSAVNLYKYTTLDEDNSNNVEANLAVLCLDCHNETSLGSKEGSEEG
jgi:hypothetical protein